MLFFFCYKQANALKDKAGRQFLMRETQKKGMATVSVLSGLYRVKLTVCLARCMHID